MAKSEFVTAAEFSRLCGVSRQAVDRARKGGKIYRDETIKKFDIYHPVNLAYLENAKARAGNDEPEAEENDYSGISPKDLPASMQELYRQKLAADTRRSEAMARRYEVDNALKTKDLVSIDLVRIFIGSFASGIQTNFLNLGNRIARDDNVLRDRIESDVKKCIERTKEMAQRALMQYNCGIERFATNPEALTEAEVIEWFKDFLFTYVLSSSSDFKTLEDADA